MYKLMLVAVMVLMAGCSESNVVDPALESMARDALLDTAAQGGADGTLTQFTMEAVGDIQMDSDDFSMDMEMDMAATTDLYVDGSFEMNMDGVITMVSDGQETIIEMAMMILCTPSSLTMHIEVTGEEAEERTVPNEAGTCDLEDDNQWQGVLDEEEMAMIEQSMGGMEFGWLSELDYEVTETKGSLGDAHVTYEATLEVPLMETPLEMGVVARAHIVGGLVQSEQATVTMDWSDEMFGQSFTVSGSIVATSEYTYGPRVAHA